MRSRSKHPQPMAIWGYSIFGFNKNRSYGSWFQGSAKKKDRTIFFKKRTTKKKTKKIQFF